MTFKTYLKSKVTFLVIWFLFHGFALFVNAFNIKGTVKSGYKCGDLYSSIHLFTNGGNFPETSDFWPFVKIVEDDEFSTNDCFRMEHENNKDYHTQNMTEVNGIFYSYDYSEFFAYSILIFIIFYFRYNNKYNSQTKKK